MADDIIANSVELVESARDLHVNSLRLELKIANAMLDASNTAREEATRERRRVRAREACAEVSHWLDAASRPARLTDAERQELSAGLESVRARFAALG
jgi:hypothetical protein